MLAERFGRLLRNRYAQLLTVVLLAQAVLYYTASHGEKIPLVRPLDQFPTTLDDWHLAQVGVIDDDTQNVLKADDLMTRWYVSPTEGGANLFVAFFKTQRTGQSPHSPKNCLPGSGWSPTATGFLDVPIPSRNETIKINRYVVTKGDSRDVVLYWYQSQNRVIADEFAAKFYLVADAIRHHRSDTALVRVIIPVDHDDDAKATDEGMRFVQAAYPALRSYLPG
jgi:EpsI family protein